MMIKEYIQHKSTRLMVHLILSILASCVMSSKPAQQEIIKSVVEDYLVDYNMYGDQEDLDGLLVFVRTDNGRLLEIIIQDYPTEHLYDDIRKDKHLESKSTIGLYGNIPIKMVVDKAVSDLDSFIERSPSLYEKAKEKPKYYDKAGNRLDIAIEEGLVEYEPILESNYQLKQDTKTVRLIDGRVLEKNYNN